MDSHSDFEEESGQFSRQQVNLEDFRLPDSPIKKKPISHSFSLNPLASDYKHYNRGSPKISQRQIGPKLRDTKEQFYSTNLRPVEKDLIDSLSETENSIPEYKESEIRSQTESAYQRDSRRNPILDQSKLRQYFDPNSFSIIEKRVISSSHGNTNSKKQLTQDILKFSDTRTPMVPFPKNQPFNSLGEIAIESRAIQNNDLQSSHFSSSNDQKNQQQHQQAENMRRRVASSHIPSDNRRAQNMVHLTEEQSSKMINRLEDTPLKSDTWHDEQQIQEGASLAEEGDGVEGEEEGYSEEIEDELSYLEGGQNSKFDRSFHESKISSRNVHVKDQLRKIFSTGRKSSYVKTETGDIVHQSELGNIRASESMQRLGVLEPQDRKSQFNRSQYSEKKSELIEPSKNTDQIFFLENLNDEEDPSKLNSFQINKSFSRHSIGVSNRSIDNDEADQPELQFEKTLHEKYEDQVEKSELLRHRSDVLDAIIDLDISQRMSILTEKILKSGWSMNKQLNQLRLPRWYMVVIISLLIFDKAGVFFPNIFAWLRKDQENKSKSFLSSSLSYSSSNPLFSICFLANLIFCFFKIFKERRFCRLVFIYQFYTAFKCVSWTT